MTTGEAVIAVIGGILGTGGVGGLGVLLGKSTERRKTEADIAAADEARAIGYRDAFIVTLQAANAKLEADREKERAAEQARFVAERDGHEECREEVRQARQETSELYGRVVVLEGANAALSSDARRARERIEKLEKKTSGQGLPAAKEG